MTRPSKGAAIFLFCFGLMFFVPGSLAFFAFVAKSPGQNPTATIASAAIALFFILVGGGLVAAGLFGYGKMKEQAALEESSPGSPWLWRKDWAVRRAESQKKKSYIAAWVICVLGNLFVLPFAVGMFPELQRQRDPRAFFVLAFCSVGPMLFGFAVRATLRHRRFGDAYLEFYDLPFSPGRHLSGRIHLKLNASPDRGIDLQLSCVRKTVTGSGDNRSTVQAVLWQTDQHVSAGAVGMGPDERTIPVDFEIPSDAYVTDKENSSDQVLWLLNAKAALPGMDYVDEFEVPVFRTAASAQAVSAESDATDSGFARSGPSEADCAPISAPLNPSVVISSQAGGTEFYFPAFRAPSQGLFLLVFTVIWTGVVYFLFHSRAPWIFALVFGFMDVILVLATFHVLLGTARITVGNGEIVSTTKTLGIGATKRFSISQVASVLPVTSGQSGRKQNVAQYAIRLLTKDGRRYTLADEIGSRQEARWIVSQIESLAGLKLDTHVQVDAPFGAPPQPPQRFQTTLGGAQAGQPGTALPGWQRRQPQSTKAVVFSFAMFAIGLAGLFAWQASRMTAFRSSANSTSRNRSTASAKAKQPPAPRIFKVPMTDADVERVLVLPAQAQAEELLERAIQHDPRALQLFDQQVESWVGHINLTERMKQLEYRSQYSTDLRVRFASADISLTLDGWQKNEEAADLLIERARTDQQYRAAAVYFLGMLAGRGVAYDKIHPVLLDYAKHDPDATVRQWAVEGMRYLGKDEALDELWESFTQDPSYSVRDRAGCNISDCGNFTRRQRMGMVPKFLDLLAGRNLDSRMRSWCFLALREITDENLPADLHAWQDWYGKRGAAKLAAFEQLEWWQVRGDE